MAMLPIYMVAPKFYSATLGVGLTAIGFTLLLVRLVDTLQDPLIGRLVDWLTAYRHGWTILLMGSAVALAAGFVLLFAPTVQGQSALLLWMAGSLILVYTAHSLMNVCYLAWGARLTDDLAGRARVTAWREASGVFGVVLASVLPAIWVAQHGPEIGYRYFTVAFVLALMLGLAVTLKFSVRPIVVVSRERPDWRSALAQPAVRRLYGFYLFNATSAAIPATLILFYVDDVLQQPGIEGLFLGVYFLAGLLTLPLWVKLSDRWGKVRAWLAGSVLASVALATAAFLGIGDVLPYVLVCLVSGAALGADLALPPAMLADAIPPSQRSNTGLYFGVWALIAKLSLALAAGAALPLLGAFGYVPGDPQTAGSLPLLYAVLPIGFKVLAAVVIWPRPLFRSRLIGGSL